MDLWLYGCSCLIVISLYLIINTFNGEAEFAANTLNIRFFSSIYEFLESTLNFELFEKKKKKKERRHNLSISEIKKTAGAAKSMKVRIINPLSVNPTKWSNTLKQFVG